MIKSILTLIIGLLYFSANCQEVRSYITTSTDVFTEGDTIIIGSPSSHLSKAYHHIKFFDLDQSRFIRYENNICLKKLPILSIKESSLQFDKPTVVLKVGKKGLLTEKLYIDIENAIYSGEIQVCTGNKSNTTSNKPTEINYFVRYLKANELDPELFKKEYLACFRSNIFKKFVDDEFVFQEILEKAKEELNRGISSIDTNTIYHINTSLKVNKYDFQKQGFSFEDSILSFAVTKNCSEYQNKRIYLQLNNFQHFRFFKFDKSKARSFTIRRKNSKGRIDRNVYVKIYFKISNKKIDNTAERVLEGHIKKIEIYERDDFRSNFMFEKYTNDQ